MDSFSKNSNEDHTPQSIWAAQTAPDGKTNNQINTHRILHGQVIAGESVKIQKG